MKFTVATTIWFVEAYAKFVFAQVVLKGENSANVIFMKYTFNIVMCQDTYKLICFKLSVIRKATKQTLQFDSSLNDLDVQPRSQSYRKTITCAAILT